MNLTDSQTSSRENAPARWLFALVLIVETVAAFGLLLLRSG